MSNGVAIVGRFVDNYGNDIVPSDDMLSYMARYYFYKGE